MAVTITSTADKEVTVILADAQKQSEIMKGEGDGERNKIFAEAFGQDPEFFSFYRSVQSYGKAFTFPPGSPLEDMFKEFGTPQERKSAALGSGFIIDEGGIVVTNNHVIQDADDIIVRVNGDQEYKAKVLGADPLMDIAVLQLDTEDKFKPVVKN